MKRRLIFLFLLVGIVPLAIASLVLYQMTQKAMAEDNKLAGTAVEERMRNRLEALRDLNMGRIETYFESIRGRIELLADTSDAREAMRGFQTAFTQYRQQKLLADADIARMRGELQNYYSNDFGGEYRRHNDGREFDVNKLLGTLDADSVALQHAYIKSNPNPPDQKERLEADDDTTDYGKLHAQYHPLFRKMAEQLGLQDIFLVDAQTGDIVYSFSKQVDFATSLKDGSQANTLFARTYQAALAAPRGTSLLSDYALYAPSYDKPEAFAGVPLYDGTTLLGVLMVQVPLDQITAVLGDHLGLGMSGQSYIVGPDHRMRSDARPGAEPDAAEYTVLNSFRKDVKVKAAGVDKALAGETGNAVTKSYHAAAEGKPAEDYLTAYAPLELGDDLKFAFITEIKSSEALELTEALRLNGQATQRKLLMTILVVFLISCVAIGIVASLVARSIAKPLLYAVDELARTASQISSVTTQLAASGAETAASISETTTAVEEIRQTAVVSREKARGVEQAADETVQYSESGRHAVEETVGGMSAIQARMETIAERVVKLSEQCQTIGQIVIAIKDFADQSNLLAVNASIEAAKAGEEGRGFAVVAQEVRSLSEQSKEATSQVQAILSEIQKATSATVMATEEGAKAVAQGVQRSQQAGKSIEELAHSIDKAAQAAILISASSQQQLVGMDQMAAAMGNINMATAQNVESVRQVEDSARLLNSLGRKLQNVVARGKAVE